MDRIPCAIIQHYIEPYSRSPKSEELCVDIKHYVSSLKKLHSIYCYSVLVDIEERIRHIYPENLLIIARSAWSFIEMDIVSYIYHYDKVDDIFSRWYRMCGLSSSLDRDIDITIINDYQKKKNAVRRFWGILTPDERSEFELHRRSLRDT